MDELPSSVSASLEDVPPPVAPSAGVSVALASSANVQAQSQKQSSDAHAVKKVRKSRVPAGVVPGVTPPPDPERWIKKSERSTFHQGKRRKGAGGGATQGMASVDLPVVSAPAASSKSGGKGKKKR